MSNTTGARPGYDDYISSEFDIIRKWRCLEDLLVPKALQRRVLFYVGEGSGSHSANQVMDRVATWLG